MKTDGVAVEIILLSQNKILFEIDWVVDVVLGSLKIILCFVILQDNFPIKNRNNTYFTLIIYLAKYDVKLIYSVFLYYSHNDLVCEY